MNQTQWMFVFLFIVAILTLGILYVSQLAYGESEKAYYIPYRNDYYLGNSPDVCLLEPAEDDKGMNTLWTKIGIENITKAGISAWTDRLNLATDNQGFYDLKLNIVPHTPWTEIPQKLKWCEIVILYKQFDLGGTGGGTYSSKSDTVQHRIIIYTSDMFGTGVKKVGNLTIKSANVVVRDVRATQVVVEHELGHAFGLGHYQSVPKTTEDKEHYQPEIASRSIMWFQSDAKYHIERIITECDINAVLELYGEDGWKDPRPWTLGRYYCDGGFNTSQK